MEHLFLFVNLGVAMAGVAAVVLGGYARTERFQKPLSALILVLVIATADYLDYVLATYFFFILELRAPVLATVSRVTGILLTGLLIWSIPRAYAACVRRPLDPVLHAVIGGVAVLVTLAFTAGFVAGVGDPVLEVLRFVQLFAELAAVVIGAAIAVGGRGAIPDVPLRRTVVSVATTHFVLVPLIVALNVTAAGRADFRTMLPFPVTPLSLSYTVFYATWVALLFRHAALALVISRSSESGLHRLCEAYRISEREREVIEQLVAGKNNQEVARTLFISPRTVDTHITNIYRKCGVKSRFELLSLIRGGQ